MAKAASFVSSLKEKYQHLSLAMPAKGEPVLNTDVLLFQRWASRVGKRWYGFALSPAPSSWATIINEFLEWLVLQAPNFEIHQIKLKFGGLRFYVSLSSEPEDFDHPENERIRGEISELEDWLQHESLCY